MDLSMSLLSFGGCQGKAVNPYNVKQSSKNLQESRICPSRNPKHHGPDCGACWKPSTLNPKPYPEPINPKPNPPPPKKKKKRNKKTNLSKPQRNSQGPQIPKEALELARSPGSRIQSRQG